MWTGWVAEQRQEACTLCLTSLETLWQWRAAKKDEEPWQEQQKNGREAAEVVWLPTRSKKRLFESLGNTNTHAHTHFCVPVDSRQITWHKLSDVTSQTEVFQKTERKRACQLGWPAITAVVPNLCGFVSGLQTGWTRWMPMCCVAVALLSWCYSFMFLCSHKLHCRCSAMSVCMDFDWLC